MIDGQSIANGQLDPGARQGRPSGWGWALVVVSALGSADIAQFLVTGWGQLASHPGRLIGSVVGLGLWLGLTLVAVLQLNEDTPRRCRAAVWLALTLAVGSVALVPIHVAAGAGGLRPTLGAVLAIVSLSLAALRRRPDWRRTGDRLHG